MTEASKKLGRRSTSTGHGRDCQCERCRGFQPGNSVATTHGSYSLLRLAPRAEEISSMIREAMADVYSPRFELFLTSTAMVGARLERALLALTSEDTDAEELERLDKDARAWVKLWFQALGRLGLDPVSASRLRASSLLGDSAQRSLAAHLMDAYGAEVVGGD